MANIKPFRGILYHKKKAPITKVVTPPYDVISPSMQNRFYRKDEHNIIKLILGKEERTDTPRNNKYKRSRKLLDKWLKKRVLVRDRKPSIYAYTQEYLHRGKKRARIGFIALMEIEDPKESGVLPHEYTLDKPKADRLNLITKTRANLSPIFSLFQDKENRINKTLKRFIKSKDPLFIVETEGVIHKFWRLENKAAIKRITSHMQNKKIFIADGHHRYEVALAYRDKMRKKSKAFKKGMDYVMMYFSNLSERGNLTILSTHRVVKNIKPFSEKKLKTNLKRHFHMKNVSNIETLIECLERGTKKKHVFGMYAGRKKIYLLTLKKTSKGLDVAILHDLIINEILGVKKPESNIKYIRNEKDAASLIDRHDYQVALFLRPTDVMAMKAVAEKGEMMPQKSTYFYPKLLTGLVINKF